MKLNKSNRIASIDVFRALTMLLMIWVNDFWTLTDIPKWLKHAHANEDYLGFSDLIFPWFLFIVGLSIPFAIENRIKKGDNAIKILLHILLRSLALLIMGLFTVNTESYHAEETGISKSWFVILMVVGFFLIWNVYPKTKGVKRYLIYGFQALGILLLAYLAYIYRGTTYPNPDTIVTFQKRWWGILGLIGWTYVIAAPVYLFFRRIKITIWIFWLAFIILNIIGNLEVPYNIFPGQNTQWIIGNGAFHAFALSGIVTSLLIRRFQDSGNTLQFFFVLLFLAILAISFGFYTHKFFIISKISTTPPWVFFSLASAFLLFIVLHWLVDVKQKQKWFNPIKTAGTATLTCYLIPYFYYSIMTAFNLKLPAVLRIGWIGLLKSLLYALTIILITWLLGRMKIKLKI